MDSENKSLLLISVGPKTAPSLVRAEGRMQPARLDPKFSPVRPCFASSTRLFGITEIEGGFPHSEIPGSKPVRGSPGLIAAYHVLHRLSAPRHPPETPLRHLIALIANARRSSLRPPRSRKLSLPRSGSKRPIQLGSLRIQPLKTEAGLALDFSKRPVLLQTHPGTLAVKLGSRLETRTAQRYEDKKNETSLAGLASRLANPVVRPNAFPLHNVKIVLAAPASPKTRSWSGHADRQTLFIEGQSLHPLSFMVEPDGIEPTTSCLQSTRSPN